jgi:hypothetical protein
VFVTSGTQRELRMRHIVLWPLRANKFIHSISQRHNYLKCVFEFSLQRFCKTFLNLRRTELDIISNGIDVDVMYPLFLSHCNGT